MNNKIKIIIGDIEFFNNLAVVNRVDGIIYCNSIDDAKDVSQKIKNCFDNLVIPGDYDGLIEFKCYPVIWLDK